MIEIHALTKRYGPTAAVSDLTFTVRPGTVTGFLGPNGAGKSTTMRMILGLDQPTSGSVLVNGRPPRAHAAPLRRGHRRGRPAGGRGPTGRQVLPRHEPAPGHRRGAAVQIAVGFLPGSWQDAVGRYLPENAGLGGDHRPPRLRKFAVDLAGFGVFCRYAAVLLTLAAVRMRRGDA